MNSVLVHKTKELNIVASPQPPQNYVTTFKLSLHCIYSQEDNSDLFFRQFNGDPNQLQRDFTRGNT